MHVGVTGIGLVADAEKTFESFDGLRLFVHLQKTARGEEERFRIGKPRREGRHLIGVRRPFKASLRLARTAEPHPVLGFVGVVEAKRPKERFGVGKALRSVEIVRERVELFERFGRSARDLRDGRAFAHGRDDSVDDFLGNDVLGQRNILPCRCRSQGLGAPEISSRSAAARLRHSAVRASEGSPVRKTASSPAFASSFFFICRKHCAA